MKVLFIALLAALAEGNVYLHSPRGSNNRLNERSAQNRNSKRLFYSNNNRRGGYNVGDKTDKAFRDEAGQYAMQYFQGGIKGKSYLTVEWTSLLGCGVDEDGDKIHDCEVVIQTNCQSDDVSGLPPSDSYTIRNGRSTNTIPYKIDPASDSRNDSIDDEEDTHDPFDFDRQIDVDDYSLQYEKDSELYNADDKITIDTNYQFYVDFDDTASDEDNDVSVSDSTNTSVDVSETDNNTNNSVPGSNQSNNDEEDEAIDTVTIQKEQTTDEGCGLGGILPKALNLFSGSSPKQEEEGATRRLAGEPESRNKKNSRRRPTQNKDYGLHESWEFYDRCGPTSSDRYGMECKSEREEWPYNSASPWVDVVYLTDDTKNKCTKEIELLNHRQFFECVEFYGNDKTFRRHKSAHKSEEECKNNGGSWMGFYKVGDTIDTVKSKQDCLNLNVGVKDHVWGRPMSWKDLAEDKLSPETCIILPTKTQCKQAPNTRNGYLGNADNSRNTPRFEWSLPNYLEDKRCVFRIRYIISVDDEIDRDEHIFYTESNDGLSLAPASSRAVFEDRSHVFKLLQRPEEIPDDLTIHNLVVRGKRGNIVQTFPAVEYDFVPNRLSIPKGDAIHVQWTGSNSHNNGNPGGDGQTGDAGEGQGGTDRNNFIQLLDRKANLVAPDHKHTLFQNAEWVWSSHDKGNVDNHAFNLALSMATSGYYQCKDDEECDKYFTNRLQDQLNNAPASYHGNIFVPDKGEYHYKCMRNDNFSNRSQKGTITVQ